MRTTTHHSRGKSGSRQAYGTHHNDRDFDLAVAPHIDPSLTPRNIEWHLYQKAAPELTFTEAELRFYEDHFSKQLNEINQNYRKNRHSERCKDMATWKSTKQNAPEESLFQIGDMHQTGEYADARTLLACYKEFALFQHTWNQEHGRPFTVLNRSLHVDEPGCPPHIHERKVWHYRAESGELRVGQERALEQAGVELPYPDQKPGRYNHRKMTYDAMMRQKWLDILQEHGIQVEREPLPDGKGKKSKEKEQFIREKYEAALNAAAVAEERAADLETEIVALQETLGLIQTVEQYQEEAMELLDTIDTAESLAQELPTAAKLFRQSAAESFVRQMGALFERLRKYVEVGIQRLLIFERAHPEEEPLSKPVQRRASGLAETLARAFAKADNENRSEGRQSRQRGIEK